jgi:dihydrofolate synthase / folylpolyglutamate synthase
MPESLEAWLAHIERQHAEPMALGLDRVSAVRQRLQQHPSCPLITVGGTNGKGSTCALLERILLCAGYRVGLYTSPHLLRYNERVRVNGEQTSDAALCQGFARVESVRGDIPLTYFEYGTLAAWEVFSASALDVVILEVGLGGRLDAVNVFDADCAVVVGVDLDHIEYLGATRDAIGFEKAGIFRPGRAAICGDRNPPARLIEHAKSIQAELKTIGHDFDYVRQDQQWQFVDWRGKRSGLAHPALRGHHQLTNASCALAALDVLYDRLPVTMQDVRRGLSEVDLPGRFQVLAGRPTVILDVAHNPQAAVVLAKNLGDMAFYPGTWAIFGMLRDKDISAVVRALRGRVTRWLPCTLNSPRSATGAEIAAALEAEGITSAAPAFDSAADAYAYAKGQAGDDDRILAFGSFFTVADVMRVLQR